MTMSLVTRSFGKMTELDDAYQVFRQNVILPDMYLYVGTVERDPSRIGGKAYNQYFQIEKGTRLSELPAEANFKILQIWSSAMTGKGGRYRQFLNNVEFDFEGFIVGMFIESLEDAIYGLMSKAERKIIDAAGLRGITDYGNLTTWANRMSKMLNGQKAQHPLRS